MTDEEKAKMLALEQFVLFVSVAGWGKEARKGIDRAANALVREYDLCGEAPK